MYDAAAAAGIPFCLSTLGTTSIEGVKAANPAGRNWFQLYVMRDREISYGLTRRAAAAGFDTLLFTVDAPVAGARLRDKRNGFSIPPQLTLGTIASAIPRPRWWIDFLTTPKLEFASLTSTGGTVGELLDAAMDPTISFADLDVIRSLWPGKIVVKGVNILKRHTKAGQRRGGVQVAQGGIVDFESPLDYSNVMLVCNKCDKPTRIRKTVLPNGDKAIVCVNCGEIYERDVAVRLLYGGRNSLIIGLVSAAICW